MRPGWQDGSVGGGACCVPADLGLIPNTHNVENTDSSLPSCLLTSTREPYHPSQISVIKLKNFTILLLDNSL